MWSQLVIQKHCGTMVKYDKIYLSGYSRTGKTVLADCMMKSRDSRWLMFTDRNYKIEMFNPKLFAFADILKNLVANHLEIEWTSEVEDGMNTLIFQGRTPREWCIKMAADYKKRLGDDYFASMLQKQMKNHCGTCVVTDLRYLAELPNESSEEKTLTIRLYRKDVHFEHNYELDMHRFDVLLCDSIESFKEILKSQPQYTSYTCKGYFNPTHDVNPCERQYLDLVQKVISSGVRKDDRTGTGTLSTFGETMRFSLKNDAFPLLTTKKVYFKGVVEELLFFIRGETNCTSLNNKGIKIWNKNAKADGSLGPVYGYQWRYFGKRWIDDNTMSLDDSLDDILDHITIEGQETHTFDGVDQLARVVEEIRNNPNSRRLVVSAWNPVDIPNMCLPPCHVMFQFNVCEGMLNCSMYQRSGDLGLGVPFNIASYSLLTIMVAHLTNLNPGEFIHHLGDAHVYLNHISALKEQLTREPRKFPRLTINTSNIRTTIDDFKASDFTLSEYNPHGSIKMDMSV